MSPVRSTRGTSQAEFFERSAAQVGELILVFGSAVGIVAVGGPLVGEDPLAGQILLWVSNVVMLALVGLSLYLRGQRWRDLGLQPQRIGWSWAVRMLWQSALVFVAAIAAFVAGSVIAGAFAGAPQSAELSSYDYLQGNLPMLLLALAAVYVVSSFGEEVLYRGYLITRLEELGGGGRFALWTAVAVSAVIFGLIHFDWGIVGMVQTGFMGGMLGVAYLVTGRNLWVLVLAHVYLDTILLVQLYLS